MKFLLGSKLNMTQIFHESGKVIPVTRVAAGPCVVTHVSDRPDGSRAVQVGFGERKAKKMNKAMQGHLKDLPRAKFLRQFVTKQELKRGDMLRVTSFGTGDRVAVTGTSKGKGFQGVVKRHGFAGSPATHGHKDQLRMPGSIGATDAARVFKGTRMGGHMGDERVTVTNLEVVGVDEEKNELLIKGAIPGARGGLVMIAAQGEMEVVVPEAPAQQKADEGLSAEQPKQEEAPKEVAQDEAPAESAPEKEQEKAEETT